MTRGRRPEHTRAWVRDVVRSGCMGMAALQQVIDDVVAADHPSLPAGTAAQWIDEAVRAWVAEAADWPDFTEHDRLQQAFGAIEDSGIPVLQSCRDHWDAQHLLDERGCRAVVWFTETDVWHAIDEPMLELNLWHADSANAAPGDGLLEEVLEKIHSQGLEAHFDEGRIEVPVLWRARPVVRHD